MANEIIRTIQSRLRSFNEVLNLDLNIFTRFTTCIIYVGFCKKVSVIFFPFNILFITKILSMWLLQCCWKLIVREAHFEYRNRDRGSNGIVGDYNDTSICGGGCICWWRGIRWEELECIIVNGCVSTFTFKYVEVKTSLMMQIIGCVTNSRLTLELEYIDTLILLRGGREARMKNIWRRSNLIKNANYFWVLVVWIFHWNFLRTSWVIFTAYIWHCTISKIPILIIYWVLIAA